MLWPQNAHNSATHCTHSLYNFYIIYIFESQLKQGRAILCHVWYLQHYYLTMQLTPVGRCGTDCLTWRVGGTLWVIRQERVSICMEQFFWRGACFRNELPKRTFVCCATQFGTLWKMRLQPNPMPGRICTAHKTENLPKQSETDIFLEPHSILIPNPKSSNTILNPKP